MTRIDDFARAQGLAPDDYAALYNWSIDDLPAFWGALWDFFALGERPGSVLADARMPGAQWFPDVRLNYVEQVLRHTGRSGAAIIGVTEDGVRTEVTWSELPGRIAAYAKLLANKGVSRGSVVAAYLPDDQDAIIAFLASATLGAVWTGCGQDYAPQGAASRMGQLEPAVLICRDGYRYRGSWVDKRSDNSVLAALLGLGPESVVTELPGGIDEVVQPVRVPFDHPLWVLFSSGTTGRPKGIVHGHGGVLLEHLKTVALHADMDESDIFFWHTALSWMMWNFRVSGLLVGATVVCYSGHPTHPDSDRLWQLLEDEKVSYFGTSPGHLQASRTAGLNPGNEHDLVLRAVGSTGSVLTADLFIWLYEHVRDDIPISSMSGGTDVVTAFAGGSPGVPVVPGELSVRYLGCALQAWAPDRTPLVDEIGEMVITEPMPSMPASFWNDPDGSKYRAAYFEHEWSDGSCPHVWRHGDWVEVTSRGSLLIRGRSDATLNRNGIRMGPADIYEVVESIDGIAEALVVGVEGPDGAYWMPLFVTLSPGSELDPELVDRIRVDIRRRLSPRHVPDEVVLAPAIPHTKTGKKLEIPVAQLLSGQHVDIDVRSIDAPEVLDWYSERGRTHAWPKTR